MEAETFRAVSSECEMNKDNLSSFPASAPKHGLSTTNHGSYLWTDEPDTH